MNQSNTQDSRFMSISLAYRSSRETMLITEMLDCHHGIQHLHFKLEKHTRYQHIRQKNCPKGLHTN